MSIDKEKVREALRRNLDLMERKNADYASMNILVEGSRGVVTRLTDKVARLRNLLDKPDGEVNFESVLDTFGDISNYGVIGQLLESGGWGHDFSHTLILGDPRSLARDKVIQMEAAFEKAGLAFCWLSSVWTYSSATPKPERLGDTFGALLDLSDLVLVLPFTNLASAVRDTRMVERARARGKTVVIVQDPSTGTCQWEFRDCHTFPTLGGAINFIFTGGLYDESRI